MTNVKIKETIAGLKNDISDTYTAIYLNYYANPIAWDSRRVLYKQQDKLITSLLVLKKRLSKDLNIVKGDM